MASAAVRAARNAAVRKRLDAAFAEFGRRLGVAPPPAQTKRMADVELQPIVELERFADFAESVLAALPDPSPPPGGGVVAFEPATEFVEGVAGGTLAGFVGSMGGPDEGGKARDDARGAATRAVAQRPERRRR